MQKIWSKEKLLLSFNISNISFCFHFAENQKNRKNKWRRNKKCEIIITAEKRRRKIKMLRRTQKNRKKVIKLFRKPPNKRCFHSAQLSKTKNVCGFWSRVMIMGVGRGLAAWNCIYEKKPRSSSKEKLSSRKTL